MGSGSASGWGLARRASSCALLLLPVWLAIACGQTIVIRIPEAPSLFGGEPAKPAATAKNGKGPAPLEKCAFMSVVIDYSREGNAEVGARVADAMAKEFDALGMHVTHSNNEAFWSLMILASENSRKDGFVFSAMLSARNMNEGYDPGVTVYQRDGERAPQGDASASPSAGRTERIPTLYNGLSYGPYAALENQAKSYVRQAYDAVYPFAQKLCAYDAADRKREQSVEDQIPPGASPL